MAGHIPTETARIPDDARGWDAAQVDPRLHVLPWANGYRCIENYEIHAYVTTGGMGSVFRAHHRALRRDYALKFPKLSTPDARARFEREARAGARSSCDHLIHVVHLGRVGKLDFLVMEWVDGGSLKVRIEGLPEGEFLPLEETLRILRGVARALQVLHADGVYHRDVKPANVMYSSKGVVKLADYGLISSDDSQDLTTADVWAGSPQYAAPEQKRGLSRAKAPADVYSLGATAFFLLTGAVPEGATPFAVPDVRPALAGVPVEVADFVCKCMRLEPAQRYVDGGAAVAALDELQQRLVARGQAVVAGAAQGGGRRSRMVVSAAVGLVCIAVAAVWWGGEPGTPVQAPAEAKEGVSLPAGPESDPSKPDVPGPAPGPAPGPKPEEKPSAEPPVPQPLPAVQSVRIAEGQQAALSTSQGSTSIVLGKVAFQATAKLVLHIEVDRACDELRVLCADKEIPPVRLPGDGKWQVEMPALAIGDTQIRVTPVRAGEKGDLYSIQVRVPCRDADLEPLLREKRGTEHPVVHYRLHLDLPVPKTEVASTLDHLFIPIRRTEASEEADLLCAEAELTIGQFRQFLDDGTAFEEGVRGFPGFVAMAKDLWPENEMDIVLAERRKVFLTQARRHSSSVPVAKLLPHEAAAFAAWLTRKGGLRGLVCRLPTTRELRGIGNLNAGLDWSVEGQRPIGVHDSVHVGDDPVVADPRTQDGPPGPPPEPESVWSRRQGLLGLFHIGGNLAEITIDEVDPAGGLRGGRCLGGSYIGPPAEIADGLVWTYQPAPSGKQANWLNLGTPSLGCRLVVVPISK